MNLCRGANRFPAFAAATLVIISWTACGAGGGTDCTPTNYVSPAAATADHSAIPPGNQVQFTRVHKLPSGCAEADVVRPGIWSTSDTVNTFIDPNTGYATCLHATSSPATISYSETPSTQFYDPATLTCR